MLRFSEYAPIGGATAARTCGKMLFHMTMFLEFPRMCLARNVAEIKDRDTNLAVAQSHLSRVMWQSLTLPATMHRSGGGGGGGAYQPFYLIEGTCSMQ